MSISDWSQKYRPLLDPPANNRAAALAQTLGGIASGGIYGRGRDEGSRPDDPGHDPNQGVPGTYTGSARDWGGLILNALFRPAGAVVGGVKSLYDYNYGRNEDGSLQGGGGSRAAEIEEQSQGQAMRDYERYQAEVAARSGSDGGGGYDGGDFGERGEMDSHGDQGSGDWGGGQGMWHHGGYVTDRNPSTYQDNMPATVQEGEFVLSRKAVGLLGRDFLERANRAARGR